MYFIRVCDMKKPIICEDMTVEKAIIDDMIDKTTGWGLIVEQVLINIEKRRDK